MPFRSPRARPRQVLALFISVVALVSFGRGTVRAAGSGTSQQDAGLSCKAIMVAGLSTGDGLYWIDPNGGDHADAFQAYCDMTTDGGGWTLAVNSVAGEEPSTNDMTSNTGVPGIDRGHTRDLTNLAINNDAQIRYYIDDPQNGRLFHAKIASRYHYPLVSFDRWTPLAGHLPGSDTLLTPESVRGWSTSLSDLDSFPNGSCSALSGVPWYYANCWSSIPGNPANGFTQGPETGGVIMTRFSIFVREVGTIPASPPPASPAKFRPAINVPTGTGPLRVAAGDFDADGRPDLVTLNSGNNTVTVRFSAGGVTQFPAGLTEFPPGSTSPTAIAIGHFNADSRLDLVVTYSAAFSRAVVFENTGSGFAPMTTITGCLGFGDIDAADFDGNGTTDLAYQCQSNPGVGIALGNGDGTFAAGPFMLTSAMAPNSLAVADFNGDARPDIIGFGGNSGCIAVMLNLGSFITSQQCFPVTTTLLSGAIGDLNNDARPDVAVATSLGLQLLQNLNGTQFSLAGSVAFPAGAGDVAIGDVNNDGRPDVIAVANTLPAVVVFRGSGGLTLQFPPGAFNVSSTPRSLAVTDLDGDGRLDVASADSLTNSVSLIYNTFGDNHAPFASDGAITAIEGASVNGMLSGYEPDGEAMTFALVTRGTKGTATLSNPATGAFSYSATAGAEGTDTFTFTVSDGLHTSDIATITVTITPKQVPRITWAPPAPITYGTPLGSLQLNATVEAGIPGTLSYSPWAGMVLPAGPDQTLTVTFTPFDQTRYVSATSAVPIDVLPAPLTVRTAAASIGLGQPLPPFTVTYQGFVNGDMPASLGGTLTFTGPSSTNAGSYPITPAGLTSPNYAIDFQPGTLTINPAPTTTVLSASLTTVAALQPFTLTATVGAVAPGAGVPAGTVTFFDGAMRVGTATSSGGVATLTVTGHIPGAHAFTATYDGGGNFAASTSAPAGVAVRDLAQSTLTFAYPLNGQQFVGLRVTLGAMVIALGGGVTPTGSVAFLDGGTLLGTAPLSGGVAHLSTNALPAGPRFIFAVYLGNATLAPSVSSPAAYNVYTSTAPLTVPMTLTSPVAPTPLGDPMTFHVAFVPLPGNETPTGTVVFLADNTLLGTAPISIFDGLARAELTTSALPAGIHLISAIYVGDGVYGAIAAGPVLREVR